MKSKILVLQPKDVETNKILTRKQDTNILTLKYQGKNYERLNIFFNTSLQQKAFEFCQKFINEHQKDCLLINEQRGFSVWSEIQQKSTKELSTPEKAEIVPANVVTTNEEKDTLETSLYITQASLLIFQIITDDIEDLMGTKQKKAFQQELTKILEESSLPGTESSKQVTYLLDIDPINTDNLPLWRQKDMENLFSQLTFVAIKYFGNTSFVERTIDVLKEISIYNQPVFINCVEQFLLLSQS
jgi:hypothetical protein